MQSYDGLLDNAKYPALKNLSQSLFILLITNHFQFRNLSHLLPAGGHGGYLALGSMPRCQKREVMSVRR